MKREVLKRWLWGVLEYLMVFPVILVIVGFTVPKEAAFAFTLMLPVHMLIALLIVSMENRLRNIILAGIGLIYVAVVTWLWHFTVLGGINEGTGITILLTGFFFIWGIRSGVKGNMSNLFFYSAGLVIHGISLFIFFKIPALLPLKEEAVAVAIVYVIAGLPLANRRFLIQETCQKSSLNIIPNSVLHGNRIIIYSILTGIFLLSIWRVFLDAFIFLMKGIAEVIGKIIEFILSTLSSDGEGSGGGMGQMELPPAKENDSILTVILNILVILMVLVLLFFLIRYILKNRKRIYMALCRLISAVFGRFQKWSSTEQGYFDQQESLLKTEIQKRPSIFRRLLKREPGWRDMKDNISRVRFIYTKFVLAHIRKGFSFSAADTPDETVARIEKWNRDDGKSHDAIREIYSNARYGEKEPDDETVKTLKDAYIK